MFKYENFIIIISSPSGAGKSTIVKALMDGDKNLLMSISATTRAPRGQEVNGREYYFLSKEDFENKIKNNEFFEYAKVFDNYYGTLKSQIEEKFKNNKDVILDIDYQGAELISKQLPKEKLLKIFILPPSMEILEERIRKRGENSEEDIQKRLKKAKIEIEYSKDYDYVIVNDQLEEAYSKIRSIIESKRIRNVLKESLEKFVENI